MKAEEWKNVSKEEVREEEEEEVECNGWEEEAVEWWTLTASRILWMSVKFPDITWVIASLYSLKFHGMRKPNVPIWKESTL